MKKVGLVAGITVSATVLSEAGRLVELVVVNKWPVLETMTHGTISMAVVAAGTSLLAWLREIRFGSGKP